MTNLFRNCAAACLVCMSMAVAVADEPGQADLDAAIDAKLSANDLDDYGTVLELCKQAIEKGLDAHRPGWHGGGGNLRFRHPRSAVAADAFVCPSGFK